MDIINDNLITRFIIDKYPNRNLGINENNCPT